MLRSYLTLALRNLKRHRFYALINVIGLSIGVGCFLIAVIYADHEYGYNRQHVKLDRTYRVILETNDFAGTRYSTNTRAMARHLEAAFPEIERAVQIFNRIMWVHTNERGFKARTCIANSSILDVFTFPILKGDPTSLNRHGTAFITAAFAQQLFGSQDPIGRTVSVDYKGSKETLKSRVSWRTSRPTTTQSFGSTSSPRHTPRVDTTS